MHSIAGIRKDYKMQSLDEKDVSPDPLNQFEKWWQEVLDSKIDEPNAMTLATSDKKGVPSARIVLLKGIEDGGFIFYTNYESHKGAELKANPNACLVFFWKELERQVRIQGIVEKTSAAASNEYYNSRPEGSRIGAWASPQSSVIKSREVLEENVTAVQKRFSGTTIERPEHWGGYAVKPFLMEFWQGRPSRLHDRIQYTKEANGNWKIERLAP